MQKRKRFVTIAFVGCLAGLSVLAGCSETKSRKAGRKLLEEIDKAGRLYARARTLLGNPVFRSEKGEYPPLPGPLVTDVQYGRLKRELIVDPRGLAEFTDEETAGTEIRRPSELNPKAWLALERAEQGLSAALAASRQDQQRQRDWAPASDRALAHAMLARIAALKGAYKAAEAAGARNDARDALDKADQAVALMQAQLGLVAYYDKLLAATDEDLKAMLARAEADAQQLKAAHDALDTEISNLEAEKQRLTVTNEKLSAEARDLHVDSRLQTGQKGLDLLEEALAIERKVNAALLEITKMVSAIEEKKVRRASLKLALDSLVSTDPGREGKIPAARGLVAARNQQAADSSKKREELLASIGKARETAERCAGIINKASAKARAAEPVAVKAFELAVEELRKCRELDSAQAWTKGALAGQADVLIATGDLHVHRLQFQRRCTRLVNGLAKAWSGTPALPAAKAPRARRSPPLVSQFKGLLDVLRGSDGRPKAAGEPEPEVPRGDLPPAITQLDQYVPKPERAGVREKAEEAYRDAAEFYRRASLDVSPELRWAYQGQHAAALIKLCDLTKDPAALKEAQAKLDKALAGKEGSPHLANVAALKQMAKGSQP